MADTVREETGVASLLDPEGERLIGEFIASVEAAAAKLPEHKATIALTIVQQNSPDLRSAASALYLCGLGHLLVPVSHHQDIFRIIVRGIFDENGDDPLDDEYNELRRPAGVILFSFARVLEALDSPNDLIDVARLFTDGRLVGQHGHRVELAMHGLWQVFGHVAPLVDATYNRLKKQSDAGKARGQEKKTAAEVWKRKALAEAERIEAVNPRLTRGELADKLRDKLRGELPDHRQVELWLQKEAEAPVGPLRSRARKPRIANEVR